VCDERVSSSSSQSTQQKVDRTAPNGDGEPPRPSSETAIKKSRIPGEEAKILVREYLRKNPCASIRKVSKATGVSQAAVCKTPAWRVKMESRDEPKRSVPERRCRQLTEGILRNRGYKDDPSSELELTELVAREMLKSASTEEKENYYAANRKKQRELLSLYAAQKRDDGTDLVVVDPACPDG
jgi:hypothetical protein